MKFMERIATKRLKDLAKSPFDLSVKGNLNPERINTYVASACGYRFLYGTERVDGSTMQALEDLAKESFALDKMKRMQSGEIINKIEGFASENRAVLHTATRDFFEEKNQSKTAQEAAGLAFKEVNKLKHFLDELEESFHFTDLVTIGIGGSDLGPRAHYVALKHLQKAGRSVHFISNVDPDEAALVLRGLDLRNTLVLVISKSGTTIETLTNEELVRSRYLKAGLDPNKHFIAVTGKGSPLDDKSRYLESFYIWDWVGGRFSTTSMVGGVILSFAFGFDVYNDFLKGANAMDKVALKSHLHENLPLLGALLAIWNRTFLQYPTLALIPYCQALSRYSAHVQQVAMESNGKHIDTNGDFVNFSTSSIIWGEPGTNSQHSFYQMIHQGTDIVPLEFIGFEKTQCEKDCLVEGTSSQQKLLSNLFAQAIALATGQKSENPNKEFKGNRPSHILLAEQLTPTSLGSLLSYYEHNIAFQGFIWGINSFDQEGVQLGKALAKEVLSCFSLDEISHPYPVGRAFLKELKAVLHK